MKILIMYGKGNYNLASHVLGINVLLLNHVMSFWDKFTVPQTHSRDFVTGLHATATFI